MAKSLKGTKTLENLMKAFAGESQARNRYTYFAGIARSEGLRQIEAIFLETADHEKEHAKRFYKAMLEHTDGAFMQEVNATYPVALGNTLENLKNAAHGENEEYTELYPAFADVADAEGFPGIAHIFRSICVAERYHEERYLKMVEILESGQAFKRGNTVIWKCRNCGYLHEAEEAPGVCPACNHKQEHFEVHTPVA